MKFADHLVNSLVPEWRDKYIDYKLGKKKLKQLLSDRDTIPKDQLISDFIEDWLLSIELTKCNNFYLWLLKQCQKKYTILQHQLRTYRQNLEDSMHETSHSQSSLLLNENRNASAGTLYGTIIYQTSMISSFKNILILFLKQNDLLPSWPKMFTVKSKDKKCRVGRNGQETFQHTTTNNKEAQYLLGEALIEFYLYLQLVRTYRDLNITGFKKIVKKFDKTFDTKQLETFTNYVNDNFSLFADSLSDNDLLHRYESKVTDWYTKDLTRNHSDIDKKAYANRLKKLTVQYSLSEQMIHRNNRSIAQMFYSGVVLGISFMLFLYTLVIIGSTISEYQSFAHKVLFPLWSGWYMVFLMGILFLLDCFVWHRTGINYKFIMFGEIHTKFGTQLFNNDFATCTIPLKLYFSTWFIFPCCLLAALSFYFNRLSPFAFFFILIIAGLFVAPSKYFIPYWGKLVGTRKWLVVTGIRLMLSGLYPVEFSDFFLGDIVCSLTYSMSDIALFFCVYSKTPNGMCSSSHLKSMGVLACLPSYWRFAQCLRRYADSNDWFPHLLNAGKYTMGIAYNASLSAYRISKRDEDKRIPFIVFATINSLYTSLWDIVMDWSLFQNSRNDNNAFLRDDLYLAGKRNWETNQYSWKRKSVYYIAMVIDVILRFQWVVYAIAPQHIQQSAVTSFTLAITEIVRRFIWIIFRVENEHVANVHLFKVSGDAPLPYAIDTSSAGYEQITSLDSISSKTPYHNDNRNTSKQTSLKIPSTAYHAIFRRKTSLFDSFSKSIPWAHATDFQRPRASSTKHTEDESETESENDSNTE